jgi:tetratricopeptide (TPR) repeat protein
VAQFAIDRNMVIFRTIKEFKNNRLMKKITFLMLCFVMSMHGFSQSLITMSNKCYEMMKTGNKANDAGQYDEALKTFDAMLSKCTAKDAKESGNVGKAHALNGLKRHDEAKAAADAAIKASKNTSIAALFERADANYSLNQLADAKADYAKITDMSEKNKNVKDRASIFSKLAELDWKQGMKEDAYNNISKAIELDPGNPDYLIMRGDFKAKEGDLTSAFENYDKALETSSDKQAVYKLRANAFTRVMQDKHKTRDAKELGQRMSTAEKEKFCQEWKRVFDGGYKNMKEELYFTLICE